MTTPKYNFNQDLVDDLARRKVVLFVGSGVTASSKTKSHSRNRTWESFLKFALQKVPNNTDKKLVRKLVAGKEYLLACEVIKEALDQNAWSNLLKNEFAQIGEASNLHRAITALGQRIVLTTNFDKFLEGAWASARSATHHPQIVNKLDTEVFKVLREEGTVIIKLHGSIDDPDSIIFAKADYAKGAFSNWVYKEFIEVLLLTHTFLFIGFSMTDPAVSLLIENYAQKYPHARPHYIFQGGSQPQRLKDISRRLRKLFVIDYSEANGHAELPRMIEALCKRVKARRKDFVADFAP